MYTDTLYTNAAIGRDPKVLSDIHLKTKNVAVFQRDYDALKTVAAQLANRSIDCRASGTIEDIIATLTTYFDNELSDHKVLLEDVLALLDMFRAITEVSFFRLLLATVSTDMCRRFHTDINTLRMLCTYLGPGTLWLPDEVVDQKAYQKGWDNEGIVLDSSLIQQVNTGDVVVLKGALYPDANPVLHRSPSIEEHGEVRLLLRIDTNENLWT